MKITITNAYTWYNKGDAGILLGTIEALKKIYYGKNLEINILSFTPEEDRKRYCTDNIIKNVYSNILNPRPYKNTKTGKLKAILKLFFKLLYIQIHFKLGKKLELKYDNLKVLTESDLIIVCGGGFLGGKKYDSFMHLYQIYLNTLYKKPVILLGSSIEPMHKGLVKHYTEKILKRVDFIFAREVITYEYLKIFMPKSKIELIPDMAFMLNYMDKNYDFIKKIKKNQHFLCGLTVRKWNFPNAKTPKEKLNNYIQILSAIIDYFFQEYNFSFVFVPQVIVENGNDTEIAKKIKENLKNSDSLFILEDDLSPAEIKGLIANFDLFLGTRMHSNIFATSMQVPTVAIAYEKKTNGIMHTVLLDSYVVEMDSLDFGELKEKLEKCFHNRETIKKNLEKQIPLIRKEIMTKLETRLSEIL